jgi:hypothetical protein
MTESTDDTVQQTLTLLRGMQDIHLTCSKLTVSDDAVTLENISIWEAPIQRFGILQDPNDQWDGHGEPA